MPDPELSSPDPDMLAALADHGEIAVDVGDGHAASNGLDVATPEGRLQFEVYPIEDYGTDHERHDPDAGVHVNRWFFVGYAVLHVHDVDADAHSLLVRDQAPDERAMELADHGVPERRAQLVALREQGLTYSEIVEATGEEGPNHRGDVSKQLQAFNRQLGDAKWLVANAETLDLGN
jgi:hypothetical protein